MVLMSDLITHVRQRSNSIGLDNITDGEILTYLNYGLAELWGIVTGSYEDYFVKTLQFNLTSGSDGYDLSLIPDFFKELRVSKLYTGSTGFVRLNRVNIRNENMGNLYSYGYLINDTPNGYLIYDNKLKILPTINNGGTYQLLYYYAWTDLTTSDTVVVGPKGQHWDLFAIYSACEALAQKDESDAVQVFMAQKAQIKDRIEEDAMNRDVGESEPLDFSSWWDR